MCFAPDSASEDDPDAGGLRPTLGKPVALRKMWALLNGNFQTIYLASKSLRPLACKSQLVRSDLGGCCEVWKRCMGCPSGSKPGPQCVVSSGTKAALLESARRHEGLRGLKSNSCSSADFCCLPVLLGPLPCLELTELNPRQRCSLSHLHCSGEK